VITWVVCPECFEALEGIPGNPCSQCGSELLEAPLVKRPYNHLYDLRTHDGRDLIKSPVEPAKDSRTRLCPYCKKNNVLHNVRGFRSCANKRCKVAALDDAMEAE
jgi:hypothetical protein